MANRNRRPTKRTRRTQNSRRSKRQTPRLPTSAIRNTSTVNVRAPAIRELCIYPRQFIQNTVDFAAAPTSIWLDSLKLLGLIALKIFIMTITSATKMIHSTTGQHFTATQSYVSSAIQSIFIGAEDVLWSSPIAEKETHRANNIDYEVPCIDFRQARLNSAVVRITCGSAVYSRAGRFVACLIDLAEEEIGEYLPDNATKPVNRIDSWSFPQVIQMAGAVTAPYGTPITLRWKARPNSFANRFLEIGQRSVEGVDFTQNLRGGKPCFRLIIGYQDFASSTGKPSSMYSPDEALIHIDIRGHVALRESGRQYIRSWPITTMDETSAGVTHSPANTYEEVPFEEFALDETGSLFRMRPITLESMALE